VADAFAIQYSFIIPVLCYMYIFYYALVGSRVKPITS
jgi:fucose permease